MVAFFRSNIPGYFQDFAFHNRRDNDVSLRRSREVWTVSSTLPSTSVVPGSIDYAVGGVFLVNVALAFFFGGLKVFQRGGVLFSPRFSVGQMGGHIGSFYI